MLENKKEETIIDNGYRYYSQKNVRIAKLYCDWILKTSYLSLVILFLLLGCATSSSQKNQDYLSLFFEQNETPKEIILIDIQKIVEEFALIINNQKLKFNKGENFEIIRKNEPIGLANVVEIDGEKVVIKATLDNKNDAISLTDKIQYVKE